MYGPQQTKIWSTSKTHYNNTYEIFSVVLESMCYIGIVGHINTPTLLKPLCCPSLQIGSSN